MNWVKQIVRLGKANCPHKKKYVFLRAKSLAPFHNNTFQNHPDHYEEIPAHVVTNYQTVEVSEVTNQQTQKRMTESNGLLELTQKSCKMDRIAEMGDFDAVTEENFVHALNFSKIDVEFAGFNIDDIQTVCSQNVDQSSLPGDSQADKETRDLEDSESSLADSENEIFIEMPNSEFIERSAVKTKGAMNSAAF